VLNKVIKTFTEQLSIMQQFKASTFYMVVHWHKLCEVDNRLGYLCAKNSQIWCRFDEVM